MSDFDCPYEIEADGKPFVRCNYPTPLDAAVRAAQWHANERRETVRLYFGGKSYDIAPTDAGAR